MARNQGWLPPSPPVRHPCGQQRDRTSGHGITLPSAPVHPITTATAAGMKMASTAHSGTAQPGNVRWGLIMSHVTRLCSRPMLVLLAQLVAPPVQVGPVRLPTPAAPEQRPAPAGSPGEKSPALEAEPSLTPTGPGASPQPIAPTPAPPLAPAPAIEGRVPLGAAELQAALTPCRAIADPVERLNACAAALNARLVSQGYTNTRVYAYPTPAPGRLELIEGRIVELRVTGSDARLNRRIRRLLQPLQGDVFYLPRVERQLLLLRRQPGVASLRVNLTRLGSDASQAALVVNVRPGAQPWQGDLSLRNDGSNGSGEFRAMASLLKPALIRQDDTLLLYSEVNGNDAPEFGSLITSISYSLPLGDQFSLTGAFGFSRRNTIELPAPGDGFSTSQYQGLGQLEWVFHETLANRWSLAASYSGNRSNSYFQDKALPSSSPDLVRQPSSGYMRLALSGSGVSDRLAWSGTAYLLQGLAAAVPESQRRELAEIQIQPSQATAIGAFASTGWGLAPSWQLNLRAAGQLAFQPLLPSMQFSLGSDVGLRGLPGQLISGDNGVLGTAETVWTFWQERQKQQALQLVPFIGAGWVSTSIKDVTISDTIGSGGLLLRWLAGDQWSAELGWVDHFFARNNSGPWNRWILGDGLYVKLGYRF